MKKSYLVAKIVFGLIAGILVTSCISESESPILTEQLEKSVALSEETTGEENLRKGNEIDYKETFTNLIGFVPAEGYAGGPAPAFYPGTGQGSSNLMKKAFSFINQYASFGPNGLTTVGAPVTQFYQAELVKLGIKRLPDEVSSITVDAHGNSIWFKNILNTTIPESNTRTNFTAEVEVVGGTGKYSGVKGSGVVIGYFDPSTGIGKSTTSAKISFRKGENPEKKDKDDDHKSEENH
jgi:hypothetical protein